MPSVTLHKACNDGDAQGLLFLCRGRTAQAQTASVLQVAAGIRSRGGEAISLAGDVTAEEFPARCVKAAVEAFGTIDILINNAGTRCSHC